MKISYKRGSCSECERDDVLIVQKSLKLCSFCNAKRLTKRYNEKRKDKVTAGEKADKTKLVKFYKEVWDRNPPLCYETGERLWNYNKWHVHHVLEKQDYPHLAFDHDVCVLLTLEQHSLWHSIAPSDRPKKMPKTFKKYLDLCHEHDLEP